MIIVDKFRELRTWYRKIYRHKYKVDLGKKPKIPYFTKLKYNIIGFTDEDYYNFNLKENDYHNYISYKERWRLEKINGKIALYLSDKLLFERLFGGYVNVPAIYCWSTNGRFVDIKTGNNIDLPELLREKKDMIAKPVSSVGGGTGVHLFRYEEGAFLEDGKKITESELRETVKKLDDCIFVQRITSAPYASAIYPDSANSMRIVSAIDGAGNVEFLLSFHRFGSDMSRPVDNISSGGLFSLIDLETGVMGNARRKTEPEKIYVSHPDTGAQIEGVRVPGWQDILKQLERAHKCFPCFKFFAWDVVLDEQDIPWILEINRGTDLGIQTIQPLRHEKFGIYMRENNLLDPW